MEIERRFTKAGESPYKDIAFEIAHLGDPKP